MTRIRKILIALSTVVVLAMASCAAVISHDSPCPEPPALAADGERMQAIMHRCYGGTDSLSYETVMRPVPAGDEMLIEVHSAALNPYDWHMMTGRPYAMRVMTGWGSPGYVGFGSDFAGTVVAVGAQVTRFKPGDEVFGSRGAALAQFVIVNETGSVTHKPPNMTFEQAAAIPIAAVTALQALRDKGLLQPGQKVLINGASGGVGTYAVQIAKALGADVTAVCSTKNIELVRSLGADHVVDYTQDDFTRRPERYHLIVDNIGNHPLLDLHRVLEPKGIVSMVGGPKKNQFMGPLWRPIRAAMLAPFIDEQLITFVSDLHQKDLEVLADLVRAGKLVTAIDRRYRFSEVPAALDYIATGRVRGKVVVSVK